MRVLEVLKYLEAREGLHSTVCVLRLSEELVTMES